MPDKEEETRYVFKFGKCRIRTTTGAPFYRNNQMTWEGLDYEQVVAMQALQVKFLADLNEMGKAAATEKKPKK